ncbi:PH domain-containing protein [Tissierella creatinophila]|uniref:YokE-like PH domain-containing protein n=1 Tax=Tissierella creatinophila DSM 6911 TaxID=1123403 RepID=A0A1U7M5C1_TISCR|nr:PH domain-containing protein [Tissierella creatinophila]OLS02388.1 hypothetical protein TICRE_16290 [Tissierella creatinophila DSM 6911]
MKIKNKRIGSFISLLLIGTLTFSFLFFTKSRHLFNFFNADQKLYITLFISLGILLIIVGFFLLIKTIKQSLTDDEISKTEHADLGVYNKVRNPFYSSIFLISSGSLLMTANFLSLGIIVTNWLILTTLIIFTKESKRNNPSDESYLKYMLKVNRLIPWFNQYFKIRSFNSKDQFYLEQAKDFLDKELIAPVMGVYFTSFPKILWFRRGICFVTEKGVGFYSYDVFRGHYGQLIAFDMISSFIYGRGMFGYSLRLQASNASINLYFIQKGNFEKITRYIKEKTNL